MLPALPEARLRQFSRGLAQRVGHSGLSDVVLVAEDQEFRSHRVILACSSEYFERMFEGAFLESQADRIQLNGKSGDAVGAVLRLIYMAASVCDVLSEDPWRLLEVYELAHEWVLPDVVEDVLKYVREDLSDVTVLAALRATLATRAPIAQDLREACEARTICLQPTPSSSGASPSRQLRREASINLNGWKSVRCPRSLGYE